MIYGSETTYCTLRPGATGKWELMSAVNGWFMHSCGNIQVICKLFATNSQYYLLTSKLHAIATNLETKIR